VAEPRPRSRANRRASPEAIQKRRAGRAFNDLLASPHPGYLDRHSQRRRARLLRELTTGCGRGAQRPLKPLEVLARVDELLALGEPADALRKVCRPFAPPDHDPNLVAVLADLHAAYRFRPEAYLLLGFDPRLLRRAGIPSSPPSRTTRPPRRPPRTGG